MKTTACLSFYTSIYRHDGGWIHAVVGTLHENQKYIYFPPIGSRLSMGDVNTRVLIVEPPFYRLFKNSYSLSRYPLSLGYLSGTIQRDTAWDVKAYNADFNPRSEKFEISYITNQGFDNYRKMMSSPRGGLWEEVRSVIEAFKPSVVAISVKAPNFAAGCFVAEIAKQVDFNTIVIVGGAHPSTVKEKVFACQPIDIAIVGEGEETIVEVLEAIESGRSLEHIPGIIYRRDKEIVVNPARRPMENLDRLCYPFEYAERVLVDFHKYPPFAFNYIMAIRGCPYNCVYCGSKYVWGRQPRFRSPGSVVAEMKALFEKGYRQIKFVDETFGVSRRYIKDLCHRIQEECPGVQWSCEFPVRLVDREIVSIMKQAGCSAIHLGIESGNNAVLASIQKGITIEEAIAACDIVREHQIRLSVFFIIGFPQETEATLNDTIGAIELIDADNTVLSIFTPYEGTECYDYLKQKGMIDDQWNNAHFNHQSLNNYFCQKIDRDTFRVKVQQLERYINMKNAQNSLLHAMALKPADIYFRIGLWKGSSILLNLMNVWLKNKLAFASSRTRTK